MNKFLLLLSFGFLSMKVAAQNPNWSEHIAPILYNKCTQCHNQNGIAPFSLITYQDAFDTHLNIQLNVNLRKMPPWPPDPNYRQFSR